MDFFVYELHHTMPCCKMKQTCPVSYAHNFNYSGTSIYRFSRGWRKETMNAGEQLIWKTITHCKYVVRSSSKVS
jgi:hypothetical protein